MKVLVLAQNYPYAGRPTAASFNERSVTVLREMCDGVEVLVPRPYAPPVIASLVPRWKVHAGIPAYEVRHGIPVYRPAYPQLPRVGGAFCVDQAAFLWCRRVAERMHRRMCFDVILSFDISAVGGIAWRLGRLFGIPASGWVTGKTPAASLKVVKRALKNLDMVFYQSHELLDHAAYLLGIARSEISRDQHSVLPRGIPSPPPFPKDAIRQRIRREWGIRDDQVLVLNIGRISHDKGSFDLLHAMALAAARDPRITCVIVGSSPDFDETTAVQQALDETPELQHKIKLLPACPPDTVWECLCAADIFAFTSHHEGMPNSLLEAMSIGVPAIAFAIPPVVELEAGSGGLLLVPPLDVASFAAAIVHLAAASDDRLRIGERGKNQVMERFMVRKNLAIALERLGKITPMKFAGTNFS